MAAKIVVACGSGVATSEMVAARLRRLLSERGAEAEVVAVDVAHVDDALEGAAAFVPVVRPERDYDVPTVSGGAFLTGMNQHKELDRLLEFLGER